MYLNIVSRLFVGMRFQLLFAHSQNPLAGTGTQRPHLEIVYPSKMKTVAYQWLLCFMCLLNLEVYFST